MMNVIAYVYVLYEFISNPMFGVCDPLFNILLLDIASLKAMRTTLTIDLKC